MSPRALAGPLVPREAWEARVEGVFRGAIALAHPDGLWVTILMSREDMEARGIWPGREAFYALAGLVVPGRTVVFSGGEDPTLETGGVRIGAGVPGTWDPRPELDAAAEAFRAAGPSAAAEAAVRIRAALAADGYSEGIHGDGPFGRRFAELRREPGFPFSLVGFGPGTTPAGDDFLAGWILGRVLRDGESESLRAVQGLGTSRTTIPGRTLLAGAALGLFPAYLVRLAAALAAAVSGGAGPARAGGRGGPDITGGRLSDFASAVRDAVSHGASSGRDAMLGLMEGVGG